MEIKTILVIGAGTMGNGIAHTFAIHGFKTILSDIDQASLKKAETIIIKNIDRQVKKGLFTEADKTRALELLTFSEQINNHCKIADLVIEAVSENLSVKLALYEKLSMLCKAETILASNTSSISITKLASVVKNPLRVIGMHFMNPVPVMKLIEMIKGHHTSQATIDKIKTLSLQINKTPILVKDYPGFIANRILMPMINEAAYGLYEGIAKVEAIDTIMQLGMSHPMGPLKLADFIGIDVCVAILNLMHHGFGKPSYTPCPLLTKMVDAQTLGVKTGSGFYDYSQGVKNAKVSNYFK